MTDHAAPQAPSDRKKLIGYLRAGGDHRQLTDKAWSALDPGGTGVRERLTGYLDAGGDRSRLKVPANPIRGPKPPPERDAFSAPPPGYPGSQGLQAQALRDLRNGPSPFPSTRVVAPLRTQGGFGDTGPQLGPRKPIHTWHPAIQATGEAVSNTLQGAAEGVLAPIAEMVDRASADGGSADADRSALALEHEKGIAKAVRPSGDAPKSFMSAADPTNSTILGEGLIPDAQRLAERVGRAASFYGTRAIRAGLGAIPQVAALGGTANALDKNLQEADAMGLPVHPLERLPMQVHEVTGEVMDESGKIVSGLTGGSELAHEIGALLPFVAAEGGGRVAKSAGRAALRTEAGQRLAPRLSAEAFKLDPHPLAPIPSAEVRRARPRPGIRTQLEEAVARNRQAREPAPVEATPRLQESPRARQVSFQAAAADLEAALRGNPSTTAPKGMTPGELRLADLRREALMERARANREARHAQEAKARADTPAARGLAAIEAEARGEGIASPDVLRAGVDSARVAAKERAPAPQVEVKLPVTAEPLPRPAREPAPVAPAPTPIKPAPAPVEPPAPLAPAPKKIRGRLDIQREKAQAAALVEPPAPSVSLAAFDSPATPSLAGSRTRGSSRLDPRATDSPVMRMPILEIDVEPETYQFRPNVDAKGVSGRMSGTKVFEPDAAGVLSVWRNPKDGRVKLINGHHRHAFMKKMGVVEADVRFIEASSAAEARMKGALINLMEGSASTLDAGAIMRELRAKGVDPKKYVADRGVSLRKRVIKDGLDIASLPDGLWEKALKGDMPEGVAVAIGRSGLDPAKMRGLSELVARQERAGKPLSPATIEELARFTNEAPTKTKTTNDLFGSSEVTESMVVEKARLSAWVRKRLAADKTLFGYVAKADRAERLSKAGNKIDVDASAKIAESAREAGAVYDRLRNYKGPISDALNVAAEKIADGAAPKDVRSALLESVREAVKTEMDGSAHAGSPKPKPSAVSKVETPETLFKDKKGNVKGYAPAVVEPPASAPQAPPATPGKVRPVRPSEIIQELRKAVKVTHRRGRISSGSKARGEFHVREEVVRTRYANDVATTAHEVGHALHKVSGLDLDALPAAVKSDLARMGKELYGDQAPTGGYASEGFAELVRRHVRPVEADIAEGLAAIEPSAATAKWFAAEWLPNQNAKTQKHLARARELGEIHETPGIEGARARIQGMIHEGAPAFVERVKGVLEKAKSLPGLVDEHLVDDLIALRRFQKEATARGAKIEGHVGPYERAVQLSRSAAARAKHFIETGQLFGHADAKGLPEIVNPILKNGKWSEFVEVVNAKRAQDSWDVGIDPGMRKADIALILEQPFAKDPAILKAAKGLNDWYDKLWQHAVVDVGGVDPAAWAKIKERNPNYIRWSRIFEEAETNRKGSPREIANGGNPIQKRTGSKKEILGPMEAAVAEAYRIISIGDKLRLAGDIVKMEGGLKGMGEWIVEVPPEKVKTTFNLDRIRSQLKEVLKDDVSPAELETSISVYMNAIKPKGGDNVLTLYDPKAGRRRWFQVNDDLYQVANELNIQDQGMFFKTLGWMSKAKRAGATTYRGGFVLANMMRDSREYLINNTAKTETQAWRNLYRGYKSAFRGGELRDLYRSSGAEVGGFAGVDRTYLARQVDKIIKSDAKSKSMRVVDPRNWLDLWLDLSGKIESGPRIGEFLNAAENLGWTEKRIRAARKAGKPIPEDVMATISNAAADVTVNFKRAGRTGRKINRVTAFFNPTVQGLEKSARQFGFRAPKGQRAALARKTALRGIAYITVPQVLEWLAFKDDPEWQDLPAWDKHGFWHIKVGDADDKVTFMRFPKPRLMQAIFGAPVLATLEATYGKDPEAFKDAFGELGKNLEINPTPDLGQLAYNLARNEDNFTDRPIVSPDLEGVEPWRQLDERSSSLSKWLGRTFNVSPQKTDYAIRSVTGGMGTDALDVVDSATSKEKKESPSAKPPVIGRFMSSDLQTKHWDRFWEKYEDIDAAVKTAQAERRKGTGEGWYPRQQLRVLTRVRRQMVDLRRQAARTEGKSDRARIIRQFREVAERADTLAREVLDSLAQYKAEK